MKVFKLNTIIRTIIPQIFYRIVAFFLLTLCLTFTLKALLTERFKTNCSRFGLIIVDEKWSGTINVTGDITVLPGTTLTIMPGTTIVMQTDQDKCSAGGSILDEMTNPDPTATKQYAKTHINISIYGSFMAQGTPDKKIIFTSSSVLKKHTDWDGIQIYGKQTRAIVEHCIIEWTHFGLAFDKTPSAIVRNTIIRHCFWGGLHAFRCSPLFENNEIYDCGHEAIDTHEASPIIRNNILHSSLVGAVLNNSAKNKPIIFDNNKIYNCSNLMCIQDNGWVIIKNNTFTASAENLPGKFTYKNFTIPFDVDPMGIELADNVKVEIENNYFTGCKPYTITYNPVGPNQGIRHTTHVPESFLINGTPYQIIIKNNTFEKTAPLKLAQYKNLQIKDNTWIK